MGKVSTPQAAPRPRKKTKKETGQVLSDGLVLRLDNLRKLEGFGFKGFAGKRALVQDKGHVAEFRAFVDRVERGGDWLIPLDELVNSTLASFAAVTSARESRVIDLDNEYGESLSSTSR